MTYLPDNVYKMNGTTYTKRTSTIWIFVEGMLEREVQNPLIKHHREGGGFQIPLTEHLNVLFLLGVSFTIESFAAAEVGCMMIFLWNILNVYTVY